MNLRNDGKVEEGHRSARLLQAAVNLSLKNVRSIEIPDQKDTDTSDIVSAEQTLNKTKATLLRSGHEREAIAIDTAIDHCLTKKEFGGLGLSLKEETSEVLQNAISFQVEAWLEALNSEDHARKLPKALSDRPKDRRPMTLSEKIFAHHSINSLRTTGMAVGDIMRVSVDWVIASELAWAGLYAGITRAGVKEVFRNDRIWIAGDHRVDPRNYDSPLSQKLIGAATKAERTFRLTENKGPNYTIMHTEFVREKAQPGTLVVGADSHTCSSGAVGCLAIGLGIADVAIPVIAGETWFRVPECINIRFVGDLPPGIGGKDVILHIMRELKRNTVAASRIVEFSGPSLKQLSIDARFAICNMCTEFGAITGICVPDEVTKSYIDSRRTKRGSQSALYFSPDEDACYSQTFDINLGNIASYIALYPSPDNVVSVKDVLGTKLDGCFIGACTTAEEDLVLAALILKAGIAQGLPLINGTRHVTPGSLPIVNRLGELGLLDAYSDAGFTRGAPGCSYCVGVVDVAQSGSVWLSSQNRNFPDRMGKGAVGNLAAATTVAASSFSMTITDPLPLLRMIDQGIWSRYKTLSARKKKGTLSTDLSTPEYVQPNFRQWPASTTENTNSAMSKPPSEQQPKQSRIKSRVAILGDFVDTDALAPSEFITSALTDEALGQHCMQYAAPDFRAKVQNGQQIVVAGKAFGVGSSREQAPRALKGLGVRCVIARSFAYIYARNQPNVGLLGIVIEDDAFYAAVEDNVEVTVELSAHLVFVGPASFPFKLDDMERRLIEQGGMAAAFKEFGKNLFGRLTTVVDERVPGIMMMESNAEPGELQW
ncbi:hypothetical protein EKO04_005150 [Ascochyta lentis]|uniref:Aconitate hydratase n=1 Tax=Ascochyta lentis TaxID=205686 RepID=A0A8H7J5B2_9PLEO|nr:hypothetical protein EKO04_005150 [Ascochyta lentis]